MTSARNIEICRAYEAGESRSSLARRYNLSRTRVQEIVRLVQDKEGRDYSQINMLWRPFPSVTQYVKVTE